VHSAAHLDPFRERLQVFVVLGKLLALVPPNSATAIALWNICDSIALVGVAMSQNKAGIREVTSLY
jgi:hypothetical protein